MLNLPTKIQTVKETKAYFEMLKNNNCLYHPDDNASDIIWDEKNRPSVSDLRKMDILMDQVFAVPSFDPYDEIITLSNL